MLSLPETTDLLARRIERAYIRRNPTWIRDTACPRVWDVAALRLIEVSMHNPLITLDPELYVAVLSVGGGRRNPWIELTQNLSKSRYISALRKIVGFLRRELKLELRRAQISISDGLELEQVFQVSRGRISPLTCYILAYHAGRLDLMSELEGRSVRQHQSCPLYRLACSSLLPDDAYPRSQTVATPIRHNQESMQFSLN